MPKWCGTFCQYDQKHWTEIHRQSQAGRGNARYIKKVSDPSWNLVGVHLLYWWSTKWPTDTLLLHGRHRQQNQWLHNSQESHISYCLMHVIYNVWASDQVTPVCWGVVVVTPEIGTAIRNYLVIEREEALDILSKFYKFVRHYGKGEENDFFLHNIVLTINQH